MVSSQKRKEIDNMPGIGEDDVRRVREASDIVTVFGERVPLRQRGHDFWCCCPIHDEKTPSCKIDPDKQLWYCFGCGAGGDVFDLIMKLDNLDFPDAVLKLAERAGIHVEQSQVLQSAPKGRKMRLKEVCKEAASFYHLQLMRSHVSGAAIARTYLSSRGFGDDVSKRWQLGYAPGGQSLVNHLRSCGFEIKEMLDANVATQAQGGVRDRFFERIMFPICDVQGDVIAFGGRIINEGNPKYLNSQETDIFHKSEVLFGLNKAKTNMASSGYAVVVEGYTDVIALFEAGIENVVATLGTALTSQHIRTLTRHAKNRIVYLFDGDEAGRRAADRALGFIDENTTPESGRLRTELAAVALPDDLDPAEFVARKGGKELVKLINQADSLISYGINRRLAGYRIDSPEQKSRALNDVLSILAPIKDSLLAKEYAVEIASRLHLRENDVLDKLSRLKAPQRTSLSSDTDPKRSISDENNQIRLSRAQLNRRNIEREFLSLCARYPHLALEQVETLAQTKWNDLVFCELAESLLAVLSKATETTTADMMDAARSAVKDGPSLLMSGVMTEQASPEKLIVFLAEELSIGDMEETINSLNQQLRDPNQKGQSEYDMLFESIVGLQKELTRLRREHKQILI